jgi:hypothetical protein
LKGANRRRDEGVEGGSERKPDAQFAEFASPCPLHVPDCLFRARQYPSRLFEEDLAGVRQLETTRNPVEKLGAQLALERLDLLAQRWLRDPQPLGGAAKVPFLGNGDEVAQMSKLHLDMLMILNNDFQYGIGNYLWPPNRGRDAPRRRSEVES